MMVRRALQIVPVIAHFHFFVINFFVKTSAIFFPNVLTAATGYYTLVHISVSPFCLLRGLRPWRFTLSAACSQCFLRMSLTGWRWIFGGGGCWSRLCSWRDRCWMGGIGWRPVGGLE